MAPPSLDEATAIELNSGSGFRTFSLFYSLYLGVIHWANQNVV